MGKINDLPMIGDIVDLEKLTGRRKASIPEDLHPVRDGWTHADSLSALFGGCDVRSGAIFDTPKMAAIVGVTKYYLKKIFVDEKAFDFVVRKENIFATYPSSLSAAWRLREARIQAGRLLSTGVAGAHLICNASSHWTEPDSSIGGASPDKAKAYR